MVLWFTSLLSTGCHCMAYCILFPYNFVSKDSQDLPKPVLFHSPPQSNDVYNHLVPITLHEVITLTVSYHSLHPTFS